MPPENFFLSLTRPLFNFTNMRFVQETSPLVLELHLLSH